MSELDQDQTEQARSLERLYNLLPSIYRLRDELQSGQLRVLMSIIESEMRLIEDDIGNLYDNWLSEACDERVVPYLRDLLAVRDLNPASPQTRGQEPQADGANPLADQQPQGTTPVLEQLARNITGWGARAVETRHLLATTQNINHVRRRNITADLRRNRQPERLGTPFEERAAYTTEIQQSASDRRGLYHPARISLYLWRLQSYPIVWGTARRMAIEQPNLKGRIFTFHPVHRDAPLFNQPQTASEITTPAEEIHLPGQLTASVLKRELEKHQQDCLEGKPADPEGYFGTQPVLQIRAIYKRYCQIIQPEEILIQALDWESKPDWQLPSRQVFYKSPPAQADRDCAKPALPRQVAFQSQVAIDPERGRLAFLTEAIPEQVEVSYSYGFSGDMGGGPYRRADLSPTGSIWLRDVFPDPIAKPNPLVAAVKEWNRIAQTMQSCSDKTFIPLARLEVQPNGDMRQLRDNLPIEIDPKLRSHFRPGIIQGLEVFAGVGDKQLTVTPGTAIDRQGRLITWKLRRRVQLGSYCSQTVLLAIVHRSDLLEAEWQVEVIAAEAARSTTVELAIPLALLKMDAEGKIAQIDQSIGGAFEPGIISGLTVPDRASGGQLVVSEGLAVNRQGQLIRLEKDVTFPSSPYRVKTAQTVILFIQVGDTPNSQIISAVPDVETGIIRVHGNGTYRGSLAIQIPEGKHVRIVAENGDRPHLQSDIFVRGIATTQAEPPGELRLEGLLLEGKVTILSGSLKQLQIAHCTLVPDAGGLEVQKAAPPLPEPEDESEVSLLALILYSLTLIQWLVQSGFGTNGSFPKQRLTRLSQVTFQRMIPLFAAMHRLLQQWQGLEADNLNPDEDDTVPFYWTGFEVDQTDGAIDLDNSQLTVTIERSICGEIALANTVPNLTIVDSIIDVGTDNAKNGAIMATGTAVEVKTSTIFGTTTVRSLEASDSIFTAKVATLRRQVGCLRFCYVPEGSQTPRRYRCQPDRSLSERITRPPLPVTTLTSNPVNHQVFAGTAGNGVFQFSDAAETWLPINDGLTNRTITALLADAKPGSGDLCPDNSSDDSIVTGKCTAFDQELQPGDTITALGQTRLVLEVLAPDRLRLDAPFAASQASFPFTIHTLLAGTTGGTLFRMMPMLKSGTGTVSSDDRRTLQGKGTLFQQELLVGDTLLVADRAVTILEIASDSELKVSPVLDQAVTEASFRVIRKRWQVMTVPTNQFESGKITGSGEIVTKNQALTSTNITTLVSYLKPGKGTITSQSTTITGKGTAFQRDFAIGDTLTVVTPTAAGQPQYQTRRIVEIHSDTRLTVQAEFAPAIATAAPYLVAGVLAGTAGDGIFRSTDRGGHWTALNQGLTHLDVRAIAGNPNNGDLFVGTNGGGVFRSTDNGQTWIGSEPAEGETFESGLTHLFITALTINPANGYLFAGTSGGGIFRSTDNGRRWSAVNQNVSHPHITSLVSYSQAGQGTIADLISNPALRLSDLLDTGITPEPRLTATTLFAGTTGGSVFRSTDNGETWQPSGRDWSDADVTAITVWMQPGQDRLSAGAESTSVTGSDTAFLQVLAGTRVGSLFRAGISIETRKHQPSRDEAAYDRWRSLNSGFSQVDETRVILNQIRPRFTSEEYGHPGYAQLSLTCPVEIRTGAEANSEMGAFNHLKQHQREANLQASLQESLRSGLRADIVYVT